MLETYLHDLSDDSDYAASQQQGSASMMTRSDSSKRSTSSEADGAEVVYSKENVTIHPTQFASERISGRLKLIKQGPLLFMAWIPYKGQNSSARLSEKDMNLYTIRAVPFTEIRSIRRHSPPLGWQYLIVVLSSGLAFPPLYFYNGGVREFLATIKQHVFVVRSAEDANVFIVNDFQDPLQLAVECIFCSACIRFVECCPQERLTEKLWSGLENFVFDWLINADRRERDNSEAERSQNLQQIHELQEHIQDKERRI